MKQTHYEVLGASPSDSPITLHLKFIKLSKATHPDAATEEEREQHVACACAFAGAQSSICGLCARTQRFQDITEAYAVLKDGERRARYDKLLSLKRQTCRKCGGTGKTSKQVSFTKVVKHDCAACGGGGYV